VGFRSRFWTVVVRPDRASALMSRPEGGLALVAAAGPDMVSWRYVFYSGPVEYEALTRADPDLGRLLFAGLWFWLRALSLALLHLLHLLITLTGNAGVAIVALAVSVKIALMPLAAVAHRLQEQVNATQARLQPGIEAINAAYKGEERTRRTLALYREQEYAKVGIPMLPVTHGSKYTRQCILFYSILLAVATLMPFATRMSGLPYLIGAVALNAGFIAYAWKLYRNYSDAVARKTFGYSIQYLAALFTLLLVDHYRMVINEALQSVLH